MPKKPKQFELLDRELVMLPAWDKRSTNPKKDYGIHGVEMRWYVKGKKGVVQFVLFTSWYTPAVDEEMYGSILDPEPSKYNHHSRVTCKPIPADLGYHGVEPRYEGQEQGDCTLLPGGKCYYDGSGMNAERMYDILREEGSEAVWKQLESYYELTFN